MVAEGRDGGQRGGRAGGANTLGPGLSECPSRHGAAKNLGVVPLSREVKGPQSEGTAPPQQREREAGGLPTWREDSYANSALQAGVSQGGMEARTPPRPGLEGGWETPPGLWALSTPGVGGVGRSSPGASPHLPWAADGTTPCPTHSGASRNDKEPSLDEMAWTWPRPPSPAKSPAPARIAVTTEGGDALSRSPLFQIPRGAVQWSSQAAAGMGGSKRPGCPLGMWNWGGAGLLAPRVLKAGGEFWGRGLPG